MANNLLTNPFANAWNYKTMGAPSRWATGGVNYMGWQNAPNAKEGYTYWKTTGDKGYDTLLSQWLSAMNQYGQNTPQAEALYRQLQAYTLANPDAANPDANKPQQAQFPGSDWIEKMFKQSSENLRMQQGSTQAQAARRGGAVAASRGMANPGGFLSATQAQVAAPYAQAFGQLETSKNQAMYGAEADKARFEESMRQAKSQEERDWIQMMFLQQDANRRYELQRQAQTPGWEDYLGMLLGGLGSWFGGGK